MDIIRRIAKSILALSIVAAMVVGYTVPAKAAAKHTVTFLYGTKQYVTTVEDGCNAAPPTDTYVPGYIFAGWAGNATNVKSDLVICAAYIKVDDPAPAPATPAQTPQTKTYTVTFVDSLTGVEYWHQTVSEGANANPPEVPHHDGYHFDRYDGDYTNVTSDRRISALYGMDAWDWHDTSDEMWWLYYSTDNPAMYQDYWWM